MSMRIRMSAINEITTPCESGRALRVRVWVNRSRRASTDGERRVGGDERVSIRPAPDWSPYAWLLWGVGEWWMSCG